MTFFDPILADNKDLPDDAQVFVDVVRPMTGPTVPKNAHIEMSYAFTLKDFRDLAATPAPVPVPVPAPDPVKMWASSDQTHVRDAATIGGKIVANLSVGQMVSLAPDFEVVADGHKWGKIVAGPTGTAGFFVAKDVLSATEIKPPVPAVLFKHKLGVHWGMEADDKAMLEILAAAYAAKNPIPFVTKLGPNGVAISDIKKASPVTKVMLRNWYPWGPNGDLDYTPPEGWDRTTFQTGYDFMNGHIDRFIEPFPDMKLADWLQVHNEPGFTSTWAPFLAWNRGALAAASKRGYKLAVFHFPGGFPALNNYPKDSGEPTFKFWVDPDVHTFLREVVAAGGVLDLHQYDLGLADWTGTFDIMRHRRIWPMLPADLQKSLKVVFGEFGQRGLKTIDQNLMLQKMKNADAMLMADSQVIGAAMWELGFQNRFEGDDITPNLQTFRTMYS